MREIMERWKSLKDMEGGRMGEEREAEITGWHGSFGSVTF
jgi:hypothetical protein